MTNPSMQCKRILLLFGGQSAEQSVSLVSAKNVYASFDMTAYEPILCYIDQKGTWWRVNDIAKPNPDARSERILLVPGASSVMIGAQLVHIDAIFPALHGTYGEDGAVQGLAHMLNVPIVGCDIDGSLLCFDKVLTKQLMALHSIPTIPYRVCQEGQSMPDYKRLAKPLGGTMFVKPARQGSSVGVSHVTNETELKSAIKEALQFDTVVLIEQAVTNARELEVAVLETTQGIETSVVGEVVPDRGFYSYESKYDAASASQLVIPALVDTDTAQRIKDMAHRAFEAMHCRGLARVDFLMDGSGNVYLNELNTMPGFTDISMYPKLWEAAGVSQTELVSMLIEQATCSR